MSYLNGYTAKTFRDALEGVPDDEPVFGALSMRKEQEVEYRDEDGEIGVRIPTPEEWEEMVSKAEALAGNDYGPWAMMWECLNDAKNEVCPMIYEDENA